MIVVAGCGSNYEDSQYRYPGFGNATAQNRSVHIVDTSPASAEDTVINMDGARAALAIERYRTGEAIQPKPLRADGMAGASGAASQ